MRHIDALKIYATKRCLIIDDMAQVRGDLKRMLRTFGLLKLDTAATSSQAIGLCQNTAYDLVLCDYNLGEGQDGQQLLEELRFRKLLKNTSLFVMITAETSRAMVLGALEYLPDDYLSKPITQLLLQTRLNKIVIRHEDLLPIKRELDNEDAVAAIAACQQKLDDNGRYTSSYLRIQAELLFRQKRYPEAREIYELSLKTQQPVWALLGLGKSYLAQEHFVQAEATLKSVAEKDMRFVETHDILAELYAQQGRFEEAQSAMEDATEFSPKSVLRQRRLAAMAKQNRDPATCLKARKQTLKFAEHSCHYTPQDYFDTCTELLEGFAGLNAREQSQRVKLVDGYLKRAKRKHPDCKSMALQDKAARVKLALLQNKGSEAKKLLAEADELLENNSIGAYARLELADARGKCGDKEGAMALLLQVSRDTPNNEDLADRVDALSDEPISRKGKKLAETLTSRGIKFFEKKSHDAAIEVFLRATSLFPNHVGLRLNIAHVALTKAVQSGVTPELQQLCQHNMAHVGMLAENHKQYARQRMIIKEMGRHFEDGLGPAASAGA